MSGSESFMKNLREKCEPIKPRKIPFSYFLMFAGFFISIGVGSYFGGLKDIGMIIICFVILLLLSISMLPLWLFSYRKMTLFDEDEGKRADREWEQERLSHAQMEHDARVDSLVRYDVKKQKFLKLFGKGSSKVSK